MIGLRQLLAMWMISFIWMHLGMSASAKPRTDKTEATPGRRGLFLFLDEQEERTMSDDDRYSAQAAIPETSHKQKKLP